MKNKIYKLLIFSTLMFFALINVTFADELPALHKCVYTQMGEKETNNTFGWGNKGQHSLAIGYSGIIIGTDTAYSGGSINKMMDITINTFNKYSNSLAGSQEAWQLPLTTVSPWQMITTKHDSDVYKGCPPVIAYLKYEVEGEGGKKYEYENAWELGDTWRVTFLAFGKDGAKESLLSLLKGMYKNINTDEIKDVTFWKLQKDAGTEYFGNIVNNTYECTIDQDIDDALKIGSKFYFSYSFKTDPKTKLKYPTIKIIDDSDHNMALFFNSYANFINIRPDTFVSMSKNKSVYLGFIGSYKNDTKGFCIFNNCSLTGRFRNFSFILAGSNEFDGMTKNIFECKPVSIQKRDPNPAECSDIFDGDFGKTIKLILNIMRIVSLVLVVVLSILDFTKALVSKDAELLNKSFSKLIKRIILLVLLFFIPALVKLLYTVSGLGTSCDV